LSFNYLLLCVCVVKFTETIGHDWNEHISVFSATFTETTLVEETRHDWNEHIQHSVVFFLIFWLVPILLLGCFGGSSEKTRID